MKIKSRISHWTGNPVTFFFLALVDVKRMDPMCNADSFSRLLVHKYLRKYLVNCIRVTDFLFPKYMLIM